jgi:hypothetical protein
MPRPAAGGAKILGGFRGARAGGGSRCVDRLIRMENAFLHRLPTPVFDPAVKYQLQYEFEAFCSEH